MNLSPMEFTVLIVAIGEFLALIFFSIFGSQSRAQNKQSMKNIEDKVGDLERDFEAKLNKIESEIEHVKANYNDKFREVRVDIHNSSESTKTLITQLIKDVAVVTTEVKNLKERKAD